MSILPYRTQQRLKRLAVVALIALVIGVIIWGLWIIWLQRFVVYTRDAGAVLNFEAETMPLDGQEALEPDDVMQVEIHYNEGEDMLNMETQMGQMNGYYVDAQTLVADPGAVWEKIKTLPAGTAVMIDVKNIYGAFYYTTSTGMPLSDTVNVAAVDELLQNLRKSNFYTIARVPALRDREFGLRNTHSGLSTGRGYLWMDEEGCYWLNPTTQDTTMHLLSIANEVRNLGFDEILFDYFYFPPTTDFIFQQDHNEALAATAQTLVDNCSAGNFTVSFINNGPAWTVPTGRTRVYMDNVSEPALLEAMVEGITLDSPEITLVFLTSNPDTRFEKYSVLRPIHMAR